MMLPFLLNFLLFYENVQMRELGILLKVTFTKNGLSTCFVLKACIFECVFGIKKNLVMKFGQDG